MNKSIFKLLLSGRFIALIFTSLVFLTACQFAENMVLPDSAQTQLTQPATSTVPTESITNPTKDTPTYKAYSAEDFQVLKGKKPLVLFFYAPWCPLCRAQDKVITSNLATFQQNTLILRVDYDSETALKQQYGITIQTSFVVLDSSGKVSSIVNDPSLDELKSAIAKSL